VMDGAAAHVLTGCRRWRPGSDDLHASSHDFGDWCHAYECGNSDARGRQTASDDSLRIDAESPCVSPDWVIGDELRDDNRAAYREIVRLPRVFSHGAFESVSPACPARAGVGGAANRASRIIAVLSNTRLRGRATNWCGSKQME
jgi:hypothetical protein